MISSKTNTVRATAEVSHELRKLVALFYLMFAIIIHSSAVVVIFHKTGMAGVWCSVTVHEKHDVAKVTKNTAENVYLALWSKSALREFNWETSTPNAGSIRQIWICGKVEHLWKIVAALPAGAEN